VAVEVAVRDSDELAVLEEGVQLHRKMLGEDQSIKHQVAPPDGLKGQARREHERHRGNIVPRHDVDVHDHAVHMVTREEQLQEVVGGPEPLVPEGRSRVRQEAEQGEERGRMQQWRRLAEEPAEGVRLREEDDVRLEHRKWSSYDGLASGSDHGLARATCARQVCFLLLLTQRRAPTATREDDRGEKAQPRRYALLTLIRQRGGSGQQQQTVRAGMCVCGEPREGE
jgi:hypothetical protein